MSLPSPQNAKLVIRPIQPNDWEAIDTLVGQTTDADSESHSEEANEHLQQLRRWRWLLRCLSWFPNPVRYAFCLYVAQVDQQIGGLIKVSPFNRTRSTWRVEHVIASATTLASGNVITKAEIGSGLLRHCFEAIWEARTWLLEVSIHHKTALALYRQNGFQPLAQLTYWAIAPELLEKLAQHEPDLPNLLPVSNADAQLLYQLDTASMPPLVRQVFDRHIQDFKTGVVKGLLENVQQWSKQEQSVRGYVFEPQRKAAIGYFKLQLCCDGNRPHHGELTVHPAYTWLYPELLSQMARISQDFPPQSLQLTSADYQPEREEYLEQIGAQRIEHSMLMSRSVWHKLREAKSASFELSEVLQGLQPARTPIPSRIDWFQSLSKKPQADRTKSASRKINARANDNQFTPNSSANLNGRHSKGKH